MRYIKILFSCFLIVAQSNVFASTNKQSYDQNIDQVSKDFEAAFIRQILNQMYKDVNIGPSQGYAADMYKQMLLEEVAKQIPKKNSIGIAKAVAKNLEKNQHIEK